ncbi:MAG: bifunctional DNA-formamidopyrimidine glycosylase/DNA-(apurinic or apyrimidinic site) lyase [Pyrinomonadaceae bacterium]
MPELPEVELVARSLDSLTAGKRIETARLLREGLAPDSPPEEFAARLSGGRIIAVGRRGKHILIELDNGLTLIVHLRMTGRFMMLGPEREMPKFAHAVFYFDDENRLVFDDQRHFGFMRISRTETVEKTKEISKLAPEPFSDEFSIEYLREKLRTSSRPVKEFLLDQTKVCGLGNIYASEALFLARINPTIPAKEISVVKTGRLHEFIRRVLGEAIDQGLAIRVDPENIDGSYFSGGFEDRWRVYGRENESCPNCGSLIKRIKQGGRSSFFCSRCQR